MSVYACSDIHGQYDLYLRMLEKIDFSEKDTLYILGDMIDRGPGSIEVLKDVIRRKNVISLLGNHELMMIVHVMDFYQKDYWFYGSNGGEVTDSAYQALPEEEKKQIQDYLMNLWLQKTVTVGGMEFLLSHSSYDRNEGDLKWMDVSYRKAFDLVWASPWRAGEYFALENYRADGRFHVIGHVPVQYIQDNPDRANAYISEENHVVNIDLGCACMEGRYFSREENALCCMNLDRYAAGAGKDAFIYIRKEKQ